MTFQDPSTTWFLAQIKPNCAKIARANLHRQGFQSFLPVEEETRTRNGKFVTTMRPVFPGYIFVAFDVANGLWRAVNSTHGIARLVSFGKEPTPVPSDLISQLKRRCDGAELLVLTATLKPGIRLR